MKLILLAIILKPIHQMIEYCRLNIDYLRSASLRVGSRRINFKKNYHNKQHSLFDSFPDVGMD
jgi:hypothetical protein